MDFHMPINFKTGVLKGQSDYVTTDSAASVVIQNDSRLVVGNGGSSTDDDFFHLTCRIDNGLKSKIEGGDYVDLDKLLPKENNMFSGRLSSTNEMKLEWVQSEGSTYLVPVKSNSTINCFRWWEQAFCIYATIYCTKNPERAREI